MIRAWLLLLVPGVASARRRTLETTTIVTPWCKDSVRIQVRPTVGGATELSTSALTDVHCAPGPQQQLGKQNSTAANGNLQVTLTETGALAFHRRDTGAILFSANVAMSPSSVLSGRGFFAANATLTAGDASERLYGLGQGNWTGPVGGYQIGGCASDNDRGSGMPERVVPLLRNGQTVKLLQRKFHVSIPWVYSTAGYGFLFNMPGYGHVQMGALGVGGMEWHAQTAPLLDIWVTTLPAGHSGGDIAPAEPIYTRYADATGHAPPLREDAMIFWQSRLRLKIQRENVVP